MIASIWVDKEPLVLCFALHVSSCDFVTIIEENLPRSFAILGRTNFVIT